MKFWTWIFIVSTEIPQSWSHYWSNSDSNDQNQNEYTKERNKTFEWKWTWNGETEYGPYQMKPAEYQLFYNPFIEKQLEKENTCENANCQRVYEPVCDNLGNIYQNPCWFNYHQCEKRKLGLQLLAAPCAYYEHGQGQRGNSETSASCDADEIRPQVMSQLAVLRDGFNQLQSRLAARVYQPNAMLVMSGVDSIKGRDRVAEMFEALHRLGINEIRMHLGNLHCSSATAASLNSDFWLMQGNSTFMSGRRLTEWKSGSHGWEIVNDYWVQDLD